MKYVYARLVSRTVVLILYYFSRHGQPDLYELSRAWTRNATAKTRPPRHPPAGGDAAAGVCGAAPAAAAAVSRETSAKLLPKAASKSLRMLRIFVAYSISAFSTPLSRASKIAKLIFFVREVKLTGSTTAVGRLDTRSSHVGERGWDIGACAWHIMRLPPYLSQQLSSSSKYAAIRASWCSLL